MNLVYKVCFKNEWDQAIINKFYSGSDVDNKDQRQKYGLHSEKNFLQYFLGEKVFRKFMDTISI